MAKDKRISLSQVCRQAQVSERTARAYLRDFNPSRVHRGHHIVTDETLPYVLALIASKRQRHCRNAFNSAMLKQESSSA